ncbi:MAG: hypothetical protein H6Q00_834 [Holophagaceae bacterium]|nr:hypothetical protein [Holophagaceae bacterium]
MSHGPLPNHIGLYGHAVGEGSLGAFRDCLARFKEMGYQFCTPGELANEPDGRWISLSFDDNYRNWTDLMAPLGELGVSATFFVNTLPMVSAGNPGEIDAYYDRIEYFGERLPLTWDDLLDIEAKGHLIGCHGHAHWPLSRVSFDAAAVDILHSKSLLEAHLGHQVKDFSFPYGMRRFFSRRLRTFCHNHGFTTIVTGIPGLQYGRKDSLWLHRTPWDFDSPIDYNLENLLVDGRIFHAVSGRSAVG